MIATYLDQPSAAVLSLTCKSLYFRLPPLFKGAQAPYLTRCGAEAKRMDLLCRD